MIVVPCQVTVTCKPLVSWVGAQSRLATTNPEAGAFVQLLGAPGSLRRAVTPPTFPMPDISQEKSAKPRSVRRAVTPPLIEEAPGAAHYLACWFGVQSLVVTTNPADRM